MITTLAVQILYKKRKVIGGELSFGGHPIETVKSPNYHSIEEVDCMLNEGWQAISSHYVTVDGIHLIHFVLHKPDE